MRMLYTSDETGTKAHRLVVMEYEPMRVPTALKGTDEMFSLWTPYLVALTRIGTNALRVFARPGPMDTEGGGNDAVYHLGWPHIGHDSRVCYHPDQFAELYTPSLTATPRERDEAQAVACMQMFLNGGSSYWLCQSNDLPQGFRHYRHDNKAPDDLYGFFRHWETLDEAQVCALQYSPYARLADIIDDELRGNTYILPGVAAFLKG